MQTRWKRDIEGVKVWPEKEKNLTWLENFRWRLKLHLKKHINPYWQQRVEEFKEVGKGYIATDTKGLFRVYEYNPTDHDDTIGICDTIIKEEEIRSVVDVLALHREKNTRAAFALREAERRMMTYYKYLGIVSRMIGKALQEILYKKYCRVGWNRIMGKRVVFVINGREYWMHTNGYKWESLMWPELEPDEVIYV